MDTPSAFGKLPGWGFGVALLACCGAALAEPESAAPVAEPTPAAMSWSTPRPQSQWAARAAEDLRPVPAAMSSSHFSVVELPSQTIPGTRAPRPQHALSIRSESPQRMLRSIGIEASECATRLRMPSKLKQDGGGLSLSVQAHVGLACRF